MKVWQDEEWRKWTPGMDVEVVSTSFPELRGETVQLVALYSDGWKVRVPSHLRHFDRTRRMAGWRLRALASPLQEKILQYIRKENNHA